MSPDPRSLSDLFDLAITHHQAGNLPEAERYYRAILQVSPAEFDALHYLGVLRAQRGHAQEAVKLIQQALKINPQSVEANSNLGNVFFETGRAEDAAKYLRKALVIQPGNVQALYALGNALRDLQQHDEALRSYDAALAIDPRFFPALNNSGDLLKRLERYQDALASFERALKIKPDEPGIFVNIGTIQRALHHPDEALASYRKALAIKPGYAEAHNDLGNTLQDQGKLDDAVASFRQALAIKPDYAEAHNNLGNALHDQGKLDDAVASYRQALSLKPEYAEAHNNLALALKEQGKLDEAIARFKKALAIKPDYSDAHNNLGFTLQDQGKLDDAIASYRKALAFKPDHAMAYSNLLFVHGYQVFLDPSAYLALARGWEQACVPASERQAARNKTFRRAPLAGRRLKVGYVSGDYRKHAVSYFVEQLFAHHDRTRIELFAYSTYGFGDMVTTRLQALADRWVAVMGMSDTAILERMEADGIDVLIDLSGHTAHNRVGVFARRAAPVQAHYLGFFASTGLTEMDYWIGDDILTPPETNDQFCEQAWRLPRVWVSYKTIADAPEPAWRPASDGSVWLGSFNNLGKLTPQTFTLWAKVLHALPQGRLLLKTTQLADAGNRQRILDTMAFHGVSPDRIDLQRNSDWADYMAQYNRLDIALDPVGSHGGGTITCDALWMGVPVIHALGNRPASRFTASMLSAIGHPEWIAQSEAEYIDKVIALARDVELRKSLRTTQRSQMARSPLCNGRDLAINLENAYIEMFERWSTQHASRARPTHNRHS